ncbi:MAG: hypothetical protein KAJ01_02615, partial [Candidatus Hydrogenedentes bacterium]|nr:hypothetical protein [Candidatus Hydrogenedentota bacterium]
KNKEKAVWNSMVEQEPTGISKTPARSPNDKHPSPSRVVSAALMVWMLGVMVLSWVLFDGPVVSSIVKRVEFFRNLREALAAFFGG